MLTLNGLKCTLYFHRPQTGNLVRTPDFKRQFSLISPSNRKFIIIVFSGFNSDNSFVLSCSRNVQLKIIIFQSHKIWYKINTRSDKAIKGTIVNRALLSLHGGSLEIPITEHVNKLNNWYLQLVSRLKLHWLHIA